MDKNFLILGSMKTIGKRKVDFVLLLTKMLNNNFDLWFLLIFTYFLTPCFGFLNALFSMVREPHIGGAVI